MKRSAILLLGLLGSISISAMANDAPRGILMELHSCELYAGGCTVSSEEHQGGRYLLRVWDFSGGRFGGTDLKGLKVAALQVSPENLAAKGSAPGNAVIYVPEEASIAQRNTLVEWLKHNQPDFQTSRLQIRVTPLTLATEATGYIFSAPGFISLQTAPLGTCTANSCGEALWYQPRTETSVFTVAINQSSQVSEPLLKLSWKDSNMRSVFLGRFGEATAAKDQFVSLTELCAPTGTL